MEISYSESESFSNVISFHGSDHKTGVTMLANSVCSAICRQHPDYSVMFLGMNKRPCSDYVREEACGIDDIKIHLDNRTLTSDEIKAMCHCRNNFYMLSGIRSLLKSRDYFPETAQYLLKTLTGCFDVIICDAGNEPDNGLVVGALKSSGQKYCVLSQCESSIREYEERTWLFRKLDIDFDLFILNKYFTGDPYDPAYLSERLGKKREDFITVRMAGYGRQAEMEHQTLLEYRNDLFGNDIDALCARILAGAGLEYKERRRRFGRSVFSGRQTS